MKVIQIIKRMAPNCYTEIYRFFFGYYIYAYGVSKHNIRSNFVETRLFKT